MGFDGPSGKLFVRLEDLAAFSSPLCLYAPLTVCLRLYFGFAGPVVSIFNCFRVLVASSSVLHLRVKVCFQPRALCFAAFCYC